MEFEPYKLKSVHNESIHCWMLDYCDGDLIKAAKPVVESIKKFVNENSVKLCKVLFVPTYGTALFRFNSVINEAGELLMIVSINYDVCINKLEGVKDVFDIRREALKVLSLFEEENKDGIVNSKNEDGIASMYPDKENQNNPEDIG